jgi:hypothetical protein
LTALVIAIVAAIAAVGSSAFAGISLSMLARQTKSLAEQTKLQAGQYEILAAATELQFNLSVMVRLQEVLLDVADDEDSYTEVWGGLQENRRPQMARDAVLDVVAMALKACDRLPNFASNENDWKSYTKYIMEVSSSLRGHVQAHPEWWPEITPYADNIQPPPAHSGRDSSTSKDEVTGDENSESPSVNGTRRAQAWWSRRRRPSAVDER